MKRCNICLSNEIQILINFGLQPLSNQFTKIITNNEYRNLLILGQCLDCGLVQLTEPVPFKELIPKVKWLKYSEPEEHLDNLSEILFKLGGLTQNPTAFGITYKDDSLLQRLSKKRFLKTWRLDPKKDLGIQQKGIASETIIPLLTNDVVKSLINKYGTVDLIIARHIFEHAANTHQLLDVLYNLLKPNGYIVFEVPDCTKQLKFNDYSMVWEEHVLYFVPETLINTIQYTNYKLVEHKLYSYPIEDSQIIIIKKKLNNKEKVNKIKPKKNIYIMARKYSDTYKSHKNAIHTFLKDYSSKVGKISVYGAGHLAVMLINSMEIESFIESVVDDFEIKQGYLLPGTKLEIKSSETIVTDKISLCVACFSPKIEGIIFNKHETYINNGGKFISAFPMQLNSLISLAMKGTLNEIN